MIDKNIKKGEFILYETDNKDKVTLSVALPAFKAKDIIWLALESLCNQILNKNIYWELLICEEYGESLDVVMNYIERLKKVNCVKITYIIINPKTEGIINNIYLLLEKWVRMAKLSLPTSKALVLMACDIYSHPKRLAIHNIHFKNENCIVSTQPVGPFYNIKNKKIFIYDGRLQSKIKSRHLNMAFKLENMKKIKVIDKRKSIDTYILEEIKRCMNIDFDPEKNIYYDLSHNWRNGFDTDGYNQISKTRKNFYNTPESTINKILKNVHKGKRGTALKKIHHVYWCLPLYSNVKRKYNYGSLENNIPINVIKRLENMTNK